MGLVLYRKYRSKSLDDVLGQEHITDTLKRAVAKGAISHAYLLTGPRGVGKTSVARILAYTFNKIDYDESKTFVDIIEIDAASNRRIDEIRELRDKINLVPSELIYKVYIIDEVHMLTREAFNALLKTLEEPPDHAIFILATTELHKVPETIISRCQRFSFKHIPIDVAVKHMKSICKQESIKIDDESLELIAAHSNGSFRDALSILDQLSSLGSKISAKDTRAVLGVSDATVVEAILYARKSGNIVELIRHYRDAIDAGNDPVILSKQIGEVLRTNLAMSSTQQNDLELLKQLLMIPQSYNPEASLEITLLDLPQNLSNQPVAKSETATKPITTPATKSATSSRSKLDSIKPKIKKKPSKTKDKPVAEQTKDLDTEKISDLPPVDAENWQAALEHIKKERNTLYSILRMAKTSIDDGNVELRFGFKFHVNRVSDAANKQLIDQAITKLGYSLRSIEFVHDKTVATQPPAASPEPTTSNDNAPAGASPKPAVPDDVANIFGEAEVLDS